MTVQIEINTLVNLGMPIEIEAEAILDE